MVMLQRLGHPVKTSAGQTLLDQSYRTQKQTLRPEQSVNRNLRRCAIGKWFSSMSPVSLAETQVAVKGVYQFRFIQ